MISTKKEEKMPENEKPLKFCMVSTFYPPYNFGGDGMHIYRLSNELARRGHTVDVFYCEDSFLMLNGSRPGGDFPNHPNVKTFGLKSGKGFLSPLLTQQTGLPVFKPQIKQALENNGYDVIHYNNMSLIGIAALGYGPSSAVKLYTTHEHWLVCPMHVLWKYNREVCVEKNCLSCQLHGRRPPQLWRKTPMFKKMLARVDRFLSPSRFTIGKHLSMGLDVPFEHMPYFLPTPPDADHDPVEQENDGRPFFLFVGRLEEIKGVQNIIPVFRRQKQFELLIVGDGAYREELERQAADCPNIKFLGRLDQRRLRGIYRQAIAVIVPSICYETFGIIIIEAFSQKTPVITNDLGALPEVVEDSGGGFIYTRESGLVEAMHRLADEPALRREMGIKGYEAFMKYWNEDAHLERYLGLIREIQAQRREKLPAGKSAAAAV
jgi:glycosyltransferase involved in cell wall biosynthesis